MNLAPNGKPSNLNAEQYKLVRTPAFKKWFGDWENDPKNASKVVDENGEPLVVYHGTYSKFTKFDREELGMSQGRSPANMFGFYFSNNKLVAQSFGKYLIACFIKIKKPKRHNLENKGYFKVKDEVNEVIKKINLKNNDGAILLNYLDSGENNPVVANQYVVPFSNQIKLADGSNTTFNADNEDIRYEQGGMTTTSAFKKWFKNSKVADKKGNPIVVYHGNPDLRGFKETYIFKSRFADDKSFFFTDNYAMAKSYANPQRAWDYQNAEEGVIALYLSLQNPMVVNANNQIWRKFETTIDGVDIVGTRDLIKYAKSKNYDGVIVQNVRDFYNDNEKKTKGGNVYVAFKESQIKLADGSNTTFNEDSDDVRYKQGGVLNNWNYSIGGL